MPINNCSINAFTLNSLKCRRSIIVSKTGKSHPQQTRFNPLSWQDHEPVDFSTVEGPNIRISIFINGETYAETYDNNFTEMRPMVAVSTLSINSKDDLPSISVINFNINPLKL